MENRKIFESSVSKESRKRGEEFAKEVYKGKNFSTNNTLGKRKESDSYFTPYELTRRFLDKWGISKVCSILEPCCGQANAIVKVLEQNRHTNIISHDLNIDGVDFLKDVVDENSIMETYSYLITNPPYSLAFEFIQKAKMVVDEEFAMLLPLSYLHGKKRYDSIWLDKKFPLKKVYIFTRYPMLGKELRDDGKMETGMMVYAWFVWDRHYEGNPEIDWIDINDCILSKKDK